MISYLAIFCFTAQSLALQMMGPPARLRQDPCEIDCDMVNVQMPNLLMEKGFTYCQRVLSEEKCNKGYLWQALNKNHSAGGIVKPCHWQDGVCDTRKDGIDWVHGCPVDPAEFCSQKVHDMNSPIKGAKDFGVLERPQAEMIEVPPSTGAACLDGTPYSFKIQRADPLRWTIYIPGGGWCSDDDECDTRLESGFHGARKNFDQEHYGTCWNYKVDAWDELHHVSCTFVELQYCDASSFAGDLDEDFVTSSGKKMKFRGRRNFQASIDILKKRYGLANATDVVLAGSSAGGVAAMLHVDGLAKQLPNTKVRGIVQDAFFLDHVRKDKTLPKYAFENIFKYHHVKGQLSSKCLQEYHGSEWLCFVGQNAARFVETPSFFMNSKYDSYQLKYIFDLGEDICLEATGKLKHDVMQYSKDFMNEFENWKRHNTHHAAYLSSCVCHDCGWEAQKVQGKNLGEIFGRWYQSSDEHSPSQILNDERPINTECNCAV